MAGYKEQHYIPRSYLKHFADGQRVTLRRRGGAPVALAPIKGVAKAKHLYSLTLDDGTRDTSAEHTLQQFEGIAAQSFDTLRAGGAVPAAGTDQRHAIGLFLGLQRLRTPEDANAYLLGARAMEYTGTALPSDAQVHDFLKSDHLGVEPGPTEVRAARDWIVATIAMGLPTKAEQLTLMFSLAIAVAEQFEAMRWSIEEFPADMLVTCDRLPATWRTPCDEDGFGGVGIEAAEQLWLPLDQRTLLVLRHTGADGQRVKSDATRARFVNAHLAKHCYRAVFHHPKLRVDPTEMPMRADRLTLRFAERPYVVDRNDAEQGELIHLWTPIRDDA